MATKITIANNALAMLADDPISDFNEGTVRSALVRDQYENIRDNCLRMIPWNCAVKRLNLSPDVATPVFGYAFQYTLPSDWLRTLSVTDEQDVYEFRIEGRKLLTDLESLQMRYIYRNDDPATYDAGLVNYMTFRLAEALAYPITKSTTQAQLMEAKAREAFMIAKGVDAQEEVQPDWFDNTLISRRGI
jgi:hypothetical protein